MRIITEMVAILACIFYSAINSIASAPSTQNTILRPTVEGNLSTQNLCGLDITNSEQIVNSNEIKIVADGCIMEHTAVFTGLTWKTINGTLQCTGKNNYLFANKAFKQGKFKVRAQLSLNKLNGTNAAFLFDNNMFIFDCDKSNFCQEKSAISFWGRELIGNGIDGYYGMRKLASASDFIHPGKLFNFELDCDGKTLRFFINGKLVGEASYKIRQPHSFGFRPCGAIMQIKEFTVSGTPYGPAKIFTPNWEYGIRLDPPVITHPLEIDRDHHILLEIQHETKPGIYNAKLIPAEGGTPTNFTLKVNKVTCDSKINSKPELKQFYVETEIPSAVLKNAFVNSRNNYAGKPFQLSLSQQKQIILQQDLILYNPNHYSEFPSCSIKKIKGTPIITVNNNPLGMIVARLTKQERNMRFSGASVRDFYNAGIIANIIAVRSSDFYNNGRFDIEKIYDYIEANICRTVANAPNALIWIDWYLYMPKEWCDQYPEEMIKLENGSNWLENSPGHILQPSYASKQWRQDAGNIIKNTFERIQRSPWADRIIMFRSQYGNAGEWNHWGYKSKQFVDFSLPMQRAFGNWLKEKYQTIENLRRAWGNPNVSFDSENLVPTTKQRIVSPLEMFHHGTEGQPTVDYYTFFQQFAVETIEYFGKILKNTTDNRILSGAYYGYFLGHLNNLPYHFQDSGHYGLKYYLESKYLDFLSGPYPYYKRKTRLQINGIYSSIALHNKIWLSENDQRTHLSAKNLHKQYGATSSVEESIEIAKRDFMVNFSKLTSYYFFDFIKDWFITPAFMQAVTRLKEIDMQSLQQGGRSSRAQVAVLFSEDNVARTGNQPILYESPLRGYQCALRNMFGTAMDRTGAPYDIYIVSDIDKIDFSQYKLVIFANSNYATDETIKFSHSKIFRDGRTILFLGLPGVLKPDGKLDYKRSLEFSGIKIAPLSTPAKYHKLVSAVSWFPGIDLKKIPFPNEYWVNPDFQIRAIINDSSVSPVAYFGDTKNIAVAEKDFATHRSIIFSALAPPEPDILQALYKRAGVHIYYDNPESQDSFYYARDLVSIFSHSGGQKKIRFSEKVEVVLDVFTGEVMGKNCSEVIFNLPLKKTTTKILFAGSKKAAKGYEQLASKKNLF